MAKDNEKTPAVDPQVSKLEAIKEIIFGQEKQDLDQKLNALREQVEQEHSSIRDEIAQLNEQVQAHLQRLEAATNQRFEQHQGELRRLDHEKAKREALGKMLIAMGEELMKD
jgi:tRNA U34 5-carboxymethylaminomethyl modifying GTPase MnmE/TrmE